MLALPASAPTTNDTLHYLSLSLPSAPSRLRGRHCRPRPNFTVPFIHLSVLLLPLLQDMAVRSWLALSPDVSVVLFSQHPSIFALARSLGPRVTVDSAIDFTYAELVHMSPLLSALAVHI
ncbi:hypothetical protein BHE74_00052456 [Ensete ventricosum]|nr:hypothetical protein BHE74_00052456 [Ensete ventricosum]RZS24892.1 hypothetical protein BHM03_00058017 [Ensete ventricosum]